MNRFILIILLIISGTLNAEVYKWTDASGDVHFSDKPHPGAEKIDLPEVQMYSTPPIPPSIPDNKQAENDSQSVYKNLAIMQPQDQATIRNNEGHLSLIAQASPGLKPGDKFQLLYDGTTLGEPQIAPVFTLKDINRGSHTLVVQIINAEGKVLISSQSTTIFMHRPRVGMGNTGR